MMQSSPSETAARDARIHETQKVRAMETVKFHEMCNTARQTSEKPVIGSTSYVHNINDTAFRDGPVVAGKDAWGRPYMAFQVWLRHGDETPELSVALFFQRYVDGYEFYAAGGELHAASEMLTDDGCYPSLSRVMTLLCGGTISALGRLGPVTMKLSV